MLTEELRGALQAATDQQPFEPDVSRLPGRIRRLRRRRTVVWLTVGATCAGVVATAGVVVTTHSGDRVSPSTLDKGSAGLVHEVENWGPTRGSFATDAAFLDRVKQEWLHPSGRYYGDPKEQGVGVVTNADGTQVVQQPDTSRHLTGDVKVLYAGQTPDGPAAVVAQRTTIKGAGIYLGIMVPTGSSDFRLVAAYTAKMYAQREFGDQGLDTNMINFKTSNAGNHLVVLPADPADGVSVSLTHTLDSSGHVQRTWSPVPTRAGVAMVTTSGPLGFWDALIRITHNNAVLDETQAWDVLGIIEDDGVDAEPPQPSNAISWPLSDQAIGGSIPGGGFVGTLNDPWLTKYATTDEPYKGQWWVNGSPQDRHAIVVGQLWFYGDPAHTVVLRVVDKQVQMLSDTITAPSERPLVFLQLPDSLGWLVVGGPDTTLTGWRAVGTTRWTVPSTFTAETVGGKPVHTSKSAFIRSTADHIQVRMDVNGKTQIASK